MTAATATAPRGTGGIGGAWPCSISWRAVLSSLRRPAVYDSAPDAPGCTANRDERQHGHEHEFVHEKIGVPGQRSRSRHGAITIRRYRRSQPEPQLTLMVRAFLACRWQRPS